ncbi:alpha/beta fold hydrolase [Streptomyces sp. NBC_00996]|uniref:alpha/beta fold hydrolase n=1 Tax=Streptomyces sp. NBC_00996 TaxID=2903710 RepID=UPI00386F831B|nr:alpha/beta fold hydrolase [Streptomyces sp. NBC_00996]
MADQVRLAYRESGNPEAPPLVLLHGLTSDGTAWDEVAAHFAGSHRVFVPDLRGHGRSPHPWQDAQRTVRAPVLVIAGGPESHLPQDEMAKMAARFPSGRLVTIPAGHRVHAARPAEFCAAVEEFLSPP